MPVRKSARWCGASDPLQFYRSPCLRMGAEFLSRRRYDEVFFVDVAIDARKKWDGFVCSAGGRIT